MRVSVSQTFHTLTRANRQRQLRVELLIAALVVLFGTTAGAATRVLDPRLENSSTLFGYSVVVIGDIDGDRVPDLAVAAPFQDGDFKGAPGFGNPQNVGKVFLISGRTLAVIRELNDPEFQVQQLQKFGGQFGTSVAAVGDINGDGVADILVGVPHHIANPEVEAEKQINAGRAFVFSGKNGALLLTLDDPTPQEGARLGAAVAAVGDVNGDGVPDLVVGAPGKDTLSVPDSQVGIVYIFSGKNGTVIRSLNYPSPGPADAGADFGAAVATARNAAGSPKVLIGAPRRSRAFIFNAVTGKLLLTLISPLAESLPSFGSAVAAGKDVDGDGIADFLVGAPLTNELRGKAFVFRGDGTLQRTLNSPDPQAFARFGASVMLIDDVTGDGKPDIVVGAPDQDVTNLLNAGEAFVFKGTDGSLFKSLTSSALQAFAGFGYSVTATDFNNDGKANLVIGVPFQNVDVIAPSGDVHTHLQVGEIELR